MHRQLPSTIRIIRTIFTLGILLMLSTGFDKPAQARRSNSRKARVLAQSLLSQPKRIRSLATKTMRAHRDGKLIRVESRSGIDGVSYNVWRFKPTGEKLKWVETKVNYEGNHSTTDLTYYPGGRMERLVTHGLDRKTLDVYQHNGSKLVMQKEAQREWIGVPLCETGRGHQWIELDW